MRRVAGMLALCTMLFVLVAPSAVASEAAEWSADGCTQAFVRDAFGGPEFFDTSAYDYIKGNADTIWVDVDPSNLGPFVEHFGLAAANYLGCIA